MKLDIKIPTMGSPKAMGEAAAKAAAAKAMPQASPNPAKASSPANIKTTFGTPTKQKK